MSTWYKNSFRRNLIDMHIDEWKDEFLSQFNENEYFKILKAGDIRSPMLYIQSHVGVCYWPTKSGHMHKAFEGREDAVRRLFELCKEDGMDVIAYYSLIYNNWAYKEYPDWRMINVHDKGSRDSGNRYGLCCPNNMKYREFIATQMNEFCDYFDFCGIFLDMTFWPMICYCPSCRKRWEEEVGGEIPTTIDWKDQRWIAFQNKRQEWLGEFAQFATTEIKKHKPECTVEHQYSTASQFWRFGVNENITIASDYAGGDLYGGIIEQSFACKLYYGLTQDQPFEYMTSRCYPNLKEHTTNKTMDQLELSVYTTYAHHGACLLIDAIDPRGTIDSRVYDKIGKVFGKSKEYEKYLTKGQLVQDVGVYFSLNSKMDVEKNNVYVGSNAAEDTTQPHLKAALGAVSSLRSHHIPVGVLNNWKLEDFKDVKVLVLPDVPFMTQIEINAVKEYVKMGGNLYLSGHTAVKLVEELFEVKYEGFTEEAVTYIAPTNDGKQYMEEYTIDYPMTFFAKQVKMSGKSNGKFLGTITLPYTVPSASYANCTNEYNEIDLIKDKKDLDNTFSSIHSNPPGIATKYPAIIKTSYGAGTVIWTSVPIEAQERFQHQEVFTNLIMDLLGEASFGSDNVSEVVEFVMFEDSQEKYLSIINLQDTFKVIDANDFDIRIKADKKPKSVKLLPSRDELAYTYMDGYTMVHIDKLHIFKMISIEK